MRLNIELKYLADYKLSTGYVGIDYDIEFKDGVFHITAKDICSTRKASVSATDSTLKATMESLWKELRGTDPQMASLVSSGAQRILTYTRAPNPSAYPSYDNGRVQLLDANGQLKYQEHLLRKAQEKQREEERNWQAARRGELVSDLTYCLPPKHQADPDNPRILTRHLKFYLKRQVSDSNGTVFYLHVEGDKCESLSLCPGRSTAQEVTNFIQTAVKQYIPQNWELHKPGKIEQSVDNIVKKAGLSSPEKKQSRSSSRSRLMHFVSRLCAD